MTTPLIRALTVAVAVSLAACGRSAPEETESESVVPVTTAMARVGDVTATIHATGLVTPAPGAELIVVAPEPARIAEMPKAEGDTVRRGDLLVRFEIPSSQAEATKQRAEIARADARLVAARAAEARMNDLFRRGVASRKEVEEATRDVADAQADLADARSAAVAADTVLARSVVRALFDGVVSMRSHNPGDLVDANATDPIIRVVDPRRLEVNAQVPLAAAPRVRAGATARVTGPAADGAPELTVRSRPVAVQEGTATVPIRLAFKTPAPYPVGAPVDLEIDADVHHQVVLVPASAIVREGEENAVFVVMGDIAHRQTVTLGVDDGRQVEVTSGVKSGDVVIVTNQNGLPDGAKVAVSKPGDGDKAEGENGEPDKP